MVALKGKSLTLQCEVNKPKGDVQWLKNGQEISPSRLYTIRAQGRERSFTIHRLTEEDSGEYSCESTDDKTSATVTVESKSLSSISFTNSREERLILAQNKSNWIVCFSAPRVVEFIAELRNITVCEGEDAIFKCVVSPADTNLVWCFNGKQVAQNDRTVISSKGLCHMLCINNCMVSDSGKVTADAEGLVSEAELQVQGELLLPLPRTLLHHIITWLYTAVLT